MKTIKKNFLDTFLLMLILLNSCDDLFIRDCGCVPPPPPPYRLGFLISLEKVKNPSVKSIKINFKNIDKIKPVVNSYYLETKGIFLVGNETPFFLEKTIKREKYKNDYGEFFFTNVSILMDFPLANTDRMFELKIYMNDKLFLTKIITLRSSKDPNYTNYYDEKEWGKDEGISHTGYTDKVEVDSKDFVKKINVGDRNGRALVIEITDADVKKFLILEKSR